MSSESIMSQSYHEDGNNRKGSEPFIISEYSSLLGDKHPNGKYTCPKCNKKSLSINKDGKKFDCYSCHDTNAIAYELRKLNGEFEPKARQNASPKSNVPSSAPRNAPQKEGDKSDLAKLLEFIQAEFKDLRLNEQSLEPYLGDKKFADAVCPLEYLYTWIADKYGKQWSKEKVTDSVMYLAGRAPFNPVRDNLMNLSNTVKVTEADIHLFDSLASHFLGTKTPLYDQYLKLWLLSAVGRVLLPGCYVRPALILKGAQGIGKTTFFKILGGDFFSSSLGDARGKDELLIAHRHWILEWGELETLWSRKELGDVKSFLTRTEDCFRAPYARAVEIHKRRFVLCGSTNEQEFLTDRTGNTRFWVIDCEDNQIELDFWADCQETVLAIATSMVRNELEYRPNHVWTGRMWELPKEYWAQNTENTALFEEQDPFEPVIEEVIDTWGDCGWIRASKIWDALDISVKEQRRYSKQVGAIMTRLGWKTSSRYIDGKSTRIWIPTKPLPNTQQPTEPEF